MPISTADLRLFSIFLSAQSFQFTPLLPFQTDRRSRRHAGEHVAREHAPQDHQHARGRVPAGGSQCRPKCARRRPRVCLGPSAPHPVPASAGEQPHAHHPTQSPPHGRGRRPQPDDTHARERLTSRPHDRLAREHHQPQHRAHQCGQSSSHVDSLFCMRDCVPCPPLPPHGRCPPTSAPPRCTVRRVLPCSRAARPPPFHPP